MYASGTIKRSEDGTNSWLFFQKAHKFVKITSQYDIIKSEYHNSLVSVLGDEEHVALGYVFEAWYQNFFIPSLNTCSLKDLFKNVEVCGLYSEMGYNIEECASSPGHESNRAEIQVYFNALQKFEQELADVIDPVSSADLMGVDNTTMNYYNKHKELVEQMYRRCQDEINLIKQTCSF